MNIEKLRSLDTLPIETARVTAVSLIDKKKTKKIVVNRLERDIQSAPSAAEISRIMWQVYLGGSGMATVGSSWKKFYKGV